LRWPRATGFSMFLSDAVVELEHRVVERLPGIVRFLLCIAARVFLSDHTVGRSRESSPTGQQEQESEPRHAHVKPHDSKHWTEAGGRLSMGPRSDVPWRGDEAPR